MAKRYLLKCYYFLVLGIVCTTFLILSTRFLVCHLSKVHIEEQLTHWVGLPVTIQKAKISWSGYKPVLHFSGVKIGESGPNKHPVSVKKLLLSINLWQSIYYQKVQPKRLLLDDATIYMHLSQEDNLSLARIDNVINQNKSENVKNFIQWFLRQKEANIRQVHIDVEYNQQYFPIELASVHFVTEDQKRSINIRARSINNVDSQFNYIGQFQGDNLEALSGQWYLSVQKLPLSFLDHHIEAGPVKLMDGVFSSKIWGTIDGGRLNHAHVESVMNQLLVKSVSLNKQSTIHKIAITATVDRAKPSINNIASDIEVIEGRKHSKYQLKLNQNHSDSQVYFSGVKLSTLKQVAAFLSLPLPKSVNATRGRIDNVQANFHQGKLESSSLTFKQVALKLDKLTANHLSGQLEYEPKRQVVKLSSQGVVIRSAHANKKVNIDKLSGWFEYDNRSAGGPVLKVRELDLSGEQNKVSGELDLHIKDSWFSSELNASLKLDLNDAAFLRPVFKLVKHYHPALKWFAKSIKSVASLKATAKTQGQIANLFNQDTPPFLQAALAVKGLDLKYHPSWPKLKQIDANIEIADNQLHGLANSLYLGAQPLKQVAFSIDSLYKHNNYLLLQGENDLDLKKVRNYLIQSPLKNKINILNELEVAKTLKTSLTLSIPIYRENPHNHLFGKVTLDNHQVTLLKPSHLDFKHANGEIVFNEEGLKTGKIESQLFGGPLSIKLDTMSDGGHPLTISAVGHAHLSKKLRDEENTVSPLYGDLGYHFQAKIESPEHYQFKFYGFNSHLQKKAELSVLDLNQLINQAEVNLTSKNNLKTLHIKTSDAIDGRITYRSDDKSINVLNGSLSIGKSIKGKLKPLTDKVAIRLKQVNLSQWLDIYHQFAKFGQSHDYSYNLAPINLKINKLIFGKLIFRDMRVNFSNQHDKWRVDVKGPDMFGRLYVIPDNDSWGVGGYLKHLNLNVESQVPVHKSASNAAEMPTFDVKIEDLKLNGNSLGSLSVNTTHNQGVYAVKNLSLMSSTHTLTLSGISKGKDSSTMTGSAKSIDLMKTLNLLGMHPVVSSKRANMTFKLQWQGGLKDFSLDKSNGYATLDLRNGRITELSKEAEGQLGLGKLISILSLQTLPRRLVLDFSDLAYKGFSYDTLKGQFSIRRGIFNTKKLLIDGPVAYVEMIGDIDVPKKRYAMKLHVSPHITASLPIVATIAGGPIAGIFTWIASKIVNQGMQKVTGYSYSLQGPWKKPQLEQIRLNAYRSR